METIWRSFEGKLYLGTAAGTIICELLTVRLLRGVGFSEQAAGAIDLRITQVALFVLGALFLWLCAALARRHVGSAVVALICAVGLEIFFFGLLGVHANFLVTLVFLAGAGAAVVWGVTRGASTFAGRRAVGRSVA